MRIKIDDNDFFSHITTQKISLRMGQNSFKLCPYPTTDVYIYTQGREFVMWFKDFSKLSFIDKITKKSR